MPVQALDHATGYLIAAAALRALTERATLGRSGRARLALAATARTLLAAGPRPASRPRDVDPTPYLQQVGPLTVVAPPGELDDTRLRWPRT